MTAPKCFVFSFTFNCKIITSLSRGDIKSLALLVRLLNHLFVNSITQKVINGFRPNANIPKVNVTLKSKSNIFIP